MKTMTRTKVKTNTARVAVFALTMAATAVVTLAVLWPGQAIAVEDNDGVAENPPVKIDALSITAVVVNSPLQAGDKPVLRVTAHNDTDKPVRSHLNVQLTSTSLDDMDSRMPSLPTVVAEQSQMVSVPAGSGKVFDLAFDKELTDGLYDVRMAPVAKNDDKKPRAFTLASFAIGIVVEEEDGFEEMDENDE